jgi:hypothetical protein
MGHNCVVIGSCEVMLLKSYTPEDVSKGAVIVLGDLAIAIIVFMLTSNARFKDLKRHVCVVLVNECLRVSVSLWPIKVHELVVRCAVHMLAISNDRSLAGHTPLSDLSSQSSEIPDTSSPSTL